MRKLHDYALVLMVAAGLGTACQVNVYCNTKADCDRGYECNGQGECVTGSASSSTGGGAATSTASGASAATSSAVPSSSAPATSTPRSSSSGVATSVTSLPGSSSSMVVPSSSHLPPPSSSTSLPPVSSSSAPASSASSTTATSAAVTSSSSQQGATSGATASSSGPALCNTHCEAPVNCAALGGDRNACQVATECQWTPAQVCVSEGTSGCGLISDPNLCERAGCSQSVGCMATPPTCDVGNCGSGCVATCARPPPDCTLVNGTCAPDCLSTGYCHANSVGTACGNVNTPGQCTGGCNWVVTSCRAPDPVDCFPVGNTCFPGCVMTQCVAGPDPCAFAGYPECAPVLGCYPVTSCTEGAPSCTNLNPAANCEGVVGCAVGQSTSMGTCSNMVQCNKGTYPQVCEPGCVCAPAGG